MANQAIEIDPDLLARLGEAEALLSRVARELAEVAAWADEEARRVGIVDTWAAGLVWTVKSHPDYPPVINYKVIHYGRPEPGPGGRQSYNQGG